VSSLLSSATGTFPIVSGLTSATAYSLQINAKPFSTSACSGAANPSACSGWEQFVYQESPSSVVFIEYWLLHWGTTCPSGWTTYTNPDINCYKNSSATDVTVPSLANWASFELVGEAASGTDEVTFYDGEGNISAEGADSVLGLEGAWNAAEFNVFGNGSGSEVDFNSGTSFVVKTSLNDGTTTAPACGTESFTAETNNLNLVGSCCPYSGSGSVLPSTQFLESNDSNATATCGTGGVQGNFAAVPTSSGSYTTSGMEFPTITFTEYLYDSTPGAQIYWQLPGCSGSASGFDPLSSGDSFTLVYQSQFDCNPSGTMYATASGYLASPVTFIDFP